MNMNKEKILISACLCGKPVRYNGKFARNLIDENEIIKRWHQEDRLVLVCPEILAGLPTPRPSAEMQGVTGEAILSSQGVVLSQTGEDFTESFIAGAKLVLEIAKTNNIKMAILKNRSPSCAPTDSYDGSFSDKTYLGRGVTAALLYRNNIKLFNEDQINLAAGYLSVLDPRN